MAHRLETAPPIGAATTTIPYRVPFYDTDAMQVVHHANYARYLELARTQLLEEHHRPYAHYVAEGLHFAVTRLELAYHRAARFDDRLEVTAWLRWVRGASIAVGYVILSRGVALATATTEHAVVDDAGMPRRIPRAYRQQLVQLLAPGARSEPWARRP